MKLCSFFAALYLAATARAADLMLSWPISGNSSYWVYKSTDLQTWAIVAQPAQPPITLHSDDPAAFFVVRPVRTSVTVSWSASTSPSVTSYKLFYWSETVGVKTTLLVGNVTATKITGLTPGMTYDFIIDACDDSGAESEPSNLAKSSFDPLSGVTLTVVPPVTVDGAAASR